MTRIEMDFYDLIAILENKYGRPVWREEILSLALVNTVNTNLPKAIQGITINIEGNNFEPPQNCRIIYYLLKQ